MTPTSTAKAPSARYLKKREGILAQAAGVFNRLGVRGATLADVAEVVDLDLTSIRHYFRKKEDLVAAAFVRSIDIHLDLIADAKSTGKPETRVRALVSNYFALRKRIRQGAEPDVMQFGDLRSLSEPYSGEIWPRYAEMFRAVREVVASPHDIENDRQRVNARTHALISQFLRSVFWLNNYEPDEFQRVEERFSDILLNGIAAKGADWQPHLFDLPEEGNPEASTVDAFLLAATELINEQGYRGASLERIAARLNLSKGAFYSHLATKDDLVIACFQRTFGILSSAQRLARSREKLALSQASAAVASLVCRQQTSAGPLLRHSALTSVDADTRRKMITGIDSVALRFGDMIADGMTDGSIRPCDPRIGGQMLLALVNSAEELSRWAPGVSAENAADLYVRPVMRGLFG